MTSLFSDTAFSHIVRAIFGHSVLRYPDEIDLPAVWQHAVHRESSIDHTKKDEGHDRQESQALAAERQHLDNDRRRASRAPSEDTHVALSAATSVSGNEKALQKPIESVEKGTDHLLVGWYGPDDTDNPQNWSRAKKLWVIVQTCALTFSIYSGSSIFTGGETEVMAQFGVSDVAATLGLSLYIVGYALGPVLFAPLGEMPQIGRMPVYIATLIVFVIFQVPTALATNFGMLMAFRFLTGFFGSPVLAVGGATMADMVTPRWREYGITMWVFSATMGPIVGPVVGGFAAQYKGWSWTIWELMWSSGACLAVLFFFYPETNPSAILAHRARRLRRITGNKNLRSQSEIDAAGITLWDTLTVVLVRPLVFNFTEPIVFALNSYLGLVYALLYSWFESFPIVFIGIYHFAPQNLGLSFIGIAIGAIVCVPLFFAYLRWYQEPREKRGVLTPEDRMLATIASAVCVPICLFWFGWSARKDIHWIMPIIGSSWFGVSIILVFNSVLNYLGEAYPLDAASVFAANMLMRSGFGAATPLFARAMYNKLGVGWASSLLGFVGAGFISVPVYLYFYGDRVRLLSKRARHDF